MIRLTEIIEELFEQCDTHFPINNSTIPLLILIKTIRYELNGDPLSLKSMCAELNASDLCTRLHITKLEKNGWLALKTSSTDKRVKLILSTPKLMATFSRLVDGLNPNIRSLMNGDWLNQ